MPGSGGKNEVRRQKLTFTHAGAGWLVQAAPRLGYAGTLTLAKLRLGAGGAATTGELMVFQGEYSTSTDPDTVPGEDRIYHDSSITLNDDAVALSLDDNISSTSGDGASYDRRASLFDNIFIATKSDGVGTIYVTVGAKDVS